LVIGTPEQRALHAQQKRSIGRRSGVRREPFARGRVATIFQSNG
jgi:hypothetical protein